MAAPIRYNVVMTFRSTPALAAALHAEAARRGVKPAEALRNAVVKMLDLDGAEATVAEEAVDIQWARITLDFPRSSASAVDGQWLMISKHSHTPPSADPAWLPLVNEDSEPFDPKLHWRGNPHYRIEPDHIARVYPVVVKCWDNA